MASGAVGYALFEKNRLVHVSDRTPIAYAELGHGHRMPVLLANGWSCSDAYWADVAPHLSELGHFAWRLIPELLTPALRAGMKNTRLSYNAAVLLKAATRKLSADRLAPYLAHLATRDPLVLFKMIESMRDHSAADLLPELATPLLILAGRKDAFTPPATQQKMHELAPGSEIVWFDDAGHCLPLEEPEGVNAAIEGFLGKLEATAA